MVQRVKWYTEYRDQGVQRVQGFRGSSSAEGPGVQRVKGCRIAGVKGCRGSRGAEGQGV